MIEDPDAQLALWMLYELHYGGFDEVPEDLEWDPQLIAVRRGLEARFEAELRAATSTVVQESGAEDDVGDALLALAGSGGGPSVAAFLQREGTAAQMREYLCERSLQQLKESDPQSFVLPRIDGAAKVALAELQYDEYGAGRPQDLHSKLYAQALAAAGLDPGYGAHVDEVTAPGLASCNVMSLFALNRRLRGAAMGHLAVFEATSSVPCRKISTGLARLGFPPDVARYFDEHVVADAVHEHLAARDICGALVAADPRQRREVLFGGACCLHVDDLVGATLLGRWCGTLQEAS